MHCKNRNIAFSEFCSLEQKWNNTLEKFQPFSIPRCWENTVQTWKSQFWEKRIYVFAKLNFQIKTVWVRHTRPSWTPNGFWSELWHSSKLAKPLSVHYQSIFSPFKVRCKVLQSQGLKSQGPLLRYTQRKRIPLLVVMYLGKFPKPKNLKEQQK